MVNLDNFEIQLDRTNAVYFPGEEVSGNVFIKVKDEPQKINEIRIQFKGEAYAEWNEGKKSFILRDTIFEIKRPLLRKQQNSSDLYLDPIENNFRFRFILPPFSLPTSYEYKYAYIRYWLKATIDVPWSINEQTTRWFTVINPLDLNRLPGIKQPYGVSDTKIICCGPCKSDPITIGFNTNKTGFVPGEVIIFNASINNSSSETIKSISALLVQRTVFFGMNWYGGQEEQTRSHTVLKLQYTGPEIGPGMHGSWTNGRLKIPPVCPSLQNTCSIIKLEYKLTLIVNVRKISNKKYVHIPIVIGTVPITDSNLPSPNINIRYYKSILDLSGKSKQYLEEEQYENELEEDDMEPLYPYYKDFY